MDRLRNNPGPDTPGKKKFSAWIVFIPVVIVLAVGGYFLLSQKEPQKPAGPLEKITFAISYNPISGPALIAFAKGHLGDEGLDVTLQLHASGKACLNAVIKGKADLATVAETPIMHAGMRGEKIYTIATIESSEKSTVVIARKDKGISTPSDLKGKRIGVTFGTSGEFALDTFIIFQGISRNDIDAVNLKPEEMLDAIIKSEVDAVTTWAPFSINVQKEMGDKGITFYTEGMYRETFNIAAMQAFVNKNPETIEKVLRALIRAESFIRENPDESRKILAEYSNMDETLLKEIWDIYSFSVRLDQSFIVTLEDEARWAIKNKLTDKKEVPNYLSFIYLDGLKKVKPEAVNVIH